MKPLKTCIAGIALFFFSASIALSQQSNSVLLVVNQNSPASRSVGDYYALKRHIPLANICRIHADTTDEVPRDAYNQTIASPIGKCLRTRGLQERVLYLVLAKGVPLRISGTGESLASDAASVDSELTLLYSDLRGKPHRIEGSIPNPYYSAEEPFTHPKYPMYLVTRLDGFDFADVKAEIDRALLARNRGKFVLDLKSSADEPGNDWLRLAAARLPKDRVILDQSDKVLTGLTDVIGYASWGSNDSNRKQRHLGFQWLPGAIATEFVSTNARTMQRPPDTWTLGTWKEPKTWFAGAPQSVTADLIHDGATGASGHVTEPYLQFTPRPDLVLPAYYKGRNLAESFWGGIPALSWMNVVLGDPLCALSH